jgi:hypothetical protein
MQAKQYPAVILTSILLITFASQPSNAFKLFHTPQPKDYEVLSYFPNGKGITTLDVVNPDTGPFTFPFGVYDSRPYIQSIKRGGTDGLLNDLNFYTTQDYGGWTFQKGNELKGSFNVRRLFACGKGGGPVLTLPTDCGISRAEASTRGIGAVLELDYRPSRNRKSRDPKPGNNSNLFWIQRVITNYAPGSPGVYQSYIDNRIEQSNGTFLNAIYPYYARGKKIGSDGYFGDRPYRLDNLNSNYYWIAELYLASSKPRQNQSPKVTIYNGVRWGWVYRYIPNNDDDSCLVTSSTGGACPPPPPPCNASSGGGGCRTSAATDYSDYQKASAFDTSDANESQYSYLSFLNFEDVSSTEDKEMSDFGFDNTNWTEDEEVSPSDEYDDSESPTSIPESTSALGLIALSAWGIIKALKIRKSQ